MARIGRKGRLWLRAFHIFFMGLYIGAAISELVIHASTGSAQSDGGLQAMYQIADAIGIGQGTGMAGTMITGLLLAWLTPWGFFKHKWVIYTAVVVFLVWPVFLLLTNRWSVSWQLWRMRRVLAPCRIRSISTLGTGSSSFGRSGRFFLFRRLLSR